jgi:spermidine/putrescine transport system substrate-binding protein
VTDPLPPRPQLARRNLLKNVAISSLAIPVVGSLSSCSTSSDSETNSQAVTVNWSNFTLYMPVDEQSAFPLVESCEKELGINISYTEDIDDNAAFFSKVKPLLDKGDSIGRDLIVVTDDFVMPWIRNGFVEQFDKTNMPNVVNNLIPSYLGAAYDPERKFTVPWQSGFTGIGFNKQKIKDLLGVDQISSMDQFFDPRLKGQILMSSEMADSIPLVMAWLGADLNNFTDEEFVKALEYVKSQIDSGQIQQIVGNESALALENGDVAAIVGYAGDLWQLGGDFGFEVPESGGLVFADNLLIPSGSENKVFAEKVVDYFYQPAIAAEVAQYVGYVSPVVGAQEEAKKLDPELAQNRWVFPSEEQFKMVKFFIIMDAAKDSLYRQEWQKILGN